MGLWDDIKEITHDIIADADIEQERINRSAKDMGARQPRQGGGFLKILLPNLAGFVVGLAFARLFGFSGIAPYLISGAVFAVAVGTLQHTIFGGMNLKSAVIRNIIIVSFFCLITALAMLMSGNR
ncbi:MAG: hypothetical protein NC340_07340 [Ruminococcus flavefaciens]|nr:hypothetical protein [Ruminococcus flavefaciens]MCM1229947.1 hypothetical protein [Ruminococcus flavefaciens]